MISRALLLFAGIVLVSLAWIFFQLWTLYDHLGGPLAAVYSYATLATLAAGAIVLVMAVLGRRRASRGSQ